MREGEARRAEGRGRARPRPILRGRSHIPKGSEKHERSEFFSALAQVPAPHTGRMSDSEFGPELEPVRRATVAARAAYGEARRGAAYLILGHYYVRLTV